MIERSSADRDNSVPKKYASSLKLTSIVPFIPRRAPNIFEWKIVQLVPKTKDVNADQVMPHLSGVPAFGNDMILQPPLPGRGAGPVRGEALIIVLCGVPFENSTKMISRFTK